LCVVCCVLCCVFCVVCCVLCVVCCVLCVLCVLCVCVCCVVCGGGGGGGVVCVCARVRACESSNLCLSQARARVWVAVSPNSTIRELAASVTAQFAKRGQPHVVEGARSCRAVTVAAAVCFSLC
jgi:hypothetical protein